MQGRKQQRRERGQRCNRLQLTHFISRYHEVFERGYLAQKPYDEFARDYYYTAYNRNVGNADCREILPVHHEGESDDYEYFIRNRVEKLAQVGNHIILARDIAVEKVRPAGYPEQHARYGAHPARQRLQAVGDDYQRYERKPCDCYFSR